MDDQFEEMLAEGPSNDLEAYKLEKYVQGHINDLDAIRQQIFEDINELKRRYCYLGQQMDSYRIKIKLVLPDFGY